MRHFLDIADCERSFLQTVFDKAIQLKQLRFTDDFPRKTLLMMFEKPSALLTTKADYWVVYTGKELLWITPIKINECIKIPVKYKIFGQIFMLFHTRNFPPSRKVYSPCPCINPLLNSPTYFPLFGTNKVPFPFFSPFT